MLNPSRKVLLAATATAVCTALLAGGKYERDPKATPECLKIGRGENGVWEYVKEWHDGYNLHPYAKIRVKVSPEGKLVHQKDNATGLLVFREISKEEYEAAVCGASM